MKTYIWYLYYIFLSDSEVNLDPGAIDTSKLILFLDSLFDSLNSSHKSAPPGKPLKGGVTKESSHISYWYDCIKILESMRFYCSVKNKFVIVPSIKNMVHTLRGFIYLSQNILQLHPKKYIILRVFQQDALENFFGCIRNYSGRENNPSASHFVTSFKALIINNFMSSHSPGANCEEDKGEGTLDNLHNFLLGEHLPTGVESLGEPLLDHDVQIPTSIGAYRKCKISRCTITYIAGFIAKKLFQKIQCDDCKQRLLFREHDADMDFIEARQYSHSNLIKPGTYLTFLFSQSMSRLFYLIPRLCHHKNISILLQSILLEQLNFNLVNNPCHPNNQHTLVKIIVRCCIFFWSKRVNKIVKGKDEKFIKYLSSNHKVSSIDPIKLQAFKKYQNKMKRAKKNR